MLFNHVDGFLLGQSVYVVRIFDFIQQVDDFLRSKSHAQTDTGASPCLGEGLQDNQVRKFVELLQERCFI